MHGAFNTTDMRSIGWTKTQPVEIEIHKSKCVITKQVYIQIIVNVNRTKVVQCWTIKQSAYRNKKKRYDL